MTREERDMSSEKEPESFEEEQMSSEKEPESFEEEQMSSEKESESFEEEQMSSEKEPESFEEEQMSSEKESESFEKEQMSYGKVRQYLSQAENARGIRPGLSRMRQLMELLENPEKRVRGIIHVAGTNGKGSILAFLDEILRCAGYRVTKYTSPAVFSYLERYTVDGQPVTEAAFASAAERVIAAAELMAKMDGDPPTAFEMETAIAWVLAADEAGDFFLVETGMGGQLDATNIAEQVTLSLIASVSRDHMAFLGNTVEEIAAQKAGIIKDGCPVVVSAANSRNISAIIERTAADHRAPLYRGDASVPYCLSLHGAYQQENASTAYAAIRVLREMGYDIPEDSVREGFGSTVWPGRFEIAGRDPLCILDGAHNADAAGRLAETLREPGFADKRKRLVLGIFKDKEYDKVVRMIAPLAEEIYVFPPESPRGLPADVLADCVRSHTECPVHVCASVEAAVGAAYEDTIRSGKQNGMILCCGSLSWLGKAKEVLKAKGSAAVD